MELITLLILIAASVGTAREYTDEDVASFPKLFHLDDYKRCLAKVDGVYCLGTFDLTPAKLPHPTYELLKSYSEESYRHFNRTRIHRGYCLSTRCPTPSLASIGSDSTSLDFEHNASLRFERCVDRYAQASGFHASLQKFDYCRTHIDTTTVQPSTTAEQIMKLVIYGLVLANIVGTIYDIYAGDSPNKNQLLSAFSIPVNWRRLTVITENDDPRLEALIPLGGIRVFALGATTYVHAGLLHSQFHTTNPEMLEQVVDQLAFMSSGSSLIQGLLMVSCFLTGYNLLIISQKYELALYMLPVCIIKRVVRITPVHLLIVGYGATWWLTSRDGPLVSTTIGLESEACKNKFWSHVFFLNNIVDTKNYCIVPTWFLAVSMHMYILACTFTLLLWRRRGFAIRLYTVLFIASCLVTAIIAYIKGYKPMLNFVIPEQFRRLFRETPSFTEFYISSWGGLPACFLGLILAHIQFELDERKIKLSEHKWFGYFQYTGFILTTIWPMAGKFFHRQDSLFINAVYIAVDKPFYCIFLAIGLLGLFNGDGPLRRFLSWRGWRSMARMSLTVMMLHWCVNMTIGARPAAYGTSVLDMVVDWCATNVITYVIAIPITVLVELPMQTFLETLMLNLYSMS